MNDRLEQMRQQDSGFTLVEMLVGMVLLGVVAAMSITTVLTVQRSSNVTMAEHDGVEEARLAPNRMTRELRQARELVRVVNPVGPGHSATGITGVTFKADFDDDGCIDGSDPVVGDAGGCNADDLGEPELLSYCHQPATPTSPEPQLFVIRGPMPATGCDDGLGNAKPILAEDVAAFRVDYRSNLYRFDTDSDGITVWNELDDAAAPDGNANDLLDSSELAGITSMVIELSLQNPGLELRTQVALRNRV